MEKAKTSTLYRLYRPTKFANVIGQEHIVKTLQNSLKQGKVNHAYLFAGPRGVGKTTLARILAKAVNCEKLENLEPCGKCRFCKAFDQGTLDLIEIDAASNRGVDEARNLREKAMFAPTELVKKVFLIDEVHMLTKDAFNALLKLLEEPPLHAMFILATTESAKIIPTVMSRCARFDFKPLGEKSLSELLKTISQKEKIKVSESASEMIIRASTGSARDLLSLLGQAIILEPNEITDETIDNLLGSGDQRQIPEFAELLIAKDAKSAIARVNEMLFSGYNAKELQEDILEYLRYLMLAVIKVSDIVCPQVYLKKITEQTERITAREVNSMIVAFLDSAKWFNLAPHPALSLEIAIIEICGDSDKNSTPVVKENSQKSKVEKNAEDNETKIPEKLKQSKAESSTKTEPVKIKGLDALWEKVLERMHSNNYSLYTCLRMCRPLSLSKNNLLVGCKYGFHKERMSEIKQKGMIIDLITELTGDKMQINFEVKNDLDLTNLNKKGSKEEVETDPLVADAKNAFAT